jgi:hypothetical protein
MLSSGSPDCLGAALRVDPKAAITRRLARSSCTPGLRFPPLKTATPDSTRSVIAMAISGGWEKKAANPSQPGTARPS